MEYPQVDIITVTYNAVPFLPDFFRGFESLAYPRERMRLLFVDNASSDGSYELANHARLPCAIELIRNSRNLGFARAHNAVFLRCSAPYIALLNPDTRVEPDWLQPLVLKMQEAQDIGIVCSQRIPHDACRLVDAATAETSWCSGGHCLIRREALVKVGWFDSRFFLYGEDVDLSWRMWLAGYRCVQVPESLCEHHFGAPERFGLRRRFFYVESYFFLRYAYGTTREIARAYGHWLWEACSLLFKKLDLPQACVVLAACISNLRQAGHFIKKRNIVRGLPGFALIKEKWIRL